MKGMRAAVIDCAAVAGLVGGREGGRGGGGGVR